MGTLYDGNEILEMFKAITLNDIWSITEQKIIDIKQYKRNCFVSK